MAPCDHTEFLISVNYIFSLSKSTCLLQLKVGSKGLGRQRRGGTLALSPNLHPNADGRSKCRRRKVSEPRGWLLNDDNHCTVHQQFQGHRYLVFNWLNSESVFY